jgi:SNF2 family DNA or RNA helicase
MIQINIKESEYLPGIKNAFVYSDTFDFELVQTLRTLKDRHYNPETKEWEIPVSAMERVINSTKMQSVKITYNVETVRKTGIPKNMVFKLQPFQHQLDGVSYGLNHPKFLLADEPGLGKTAQVANIAVCRKLRKEVKQVLIVCCVNSIKYNWLTEIKKHTNESCFVLGSRFRKNGNMYSGTVKDRIDDVRSHNEFFLITNMETLRNSDFVDAILAKKSIGMVVVDECHFMRNYNAAQTKGFLRLKDYDYKIAVSGTPIVNSPLDAYTTLSWLGYEKSSYFVFRKYYCQFNGMGGQVTGYRNLGKLREVINENMLRRLKDDVLDLPPKIETEEYLDMPKEQWQIYDELRNEILENIDLIVESPNPLSMLLRLRQATCDTSILSSTIHCSVKYDRLKEIVYELSQSGQKCLIFSSWTTVTRKVKELLSEYNPAYITGEIETVDRTREEKKFMTDDSCKVCIGSIGAMGTGLTLTAASTVVFLDLPWHKAAFEQCCDRAHRISQKGTVNIKILICKDTIDERILDIVYRKGEMASALVDGVVHTKISKNQILRLIS